MVCSMLERAQEAHSDQPASTPRRIPGLAGGRPRLISLAVASLVVAWLAVDVVGSPGLLVLVGGVCLSLATGRLVPRLAGPASWAAAVILEFVFICGLSAVQAILSAKEHGERANLAILLAPILVSLAVLAALQRRPGATPAPQRPFTAPVVFVVLIVGLAVPAWIAAKGRSYGLAWSMSGDGRNHVLLLRAILTHGGLTVGQLKTYPLFVNTVSAVLSSAGGRAGLAPGTLMLHDAASLSATYVLSGLALALMFVAAILESLPKAVRQARRLPAGVVVVVLFAALTALSSFVLGTSLLDGFFTTYGTLPAVVASLVLALRCLNEPSPTAFGLMTPAMGIAIFGWTILVVIPAVVALALAVALTTQRRSWSTWPAQRDAWLVSVAVVAVGVIATAGILVSHYHTLRQQFLTPGPEPTPAKHWVLYLLLLIAVFLLVTSPGPEEVRSRALVVVVALASVGTVYYLRSITPDGQTWTYYAAKALWACGASLLWLLFVPLALHSASATRPAAPRWRAAQQTVAYAAAATALLIVVGFLTKVQDPVHEASSGWTQPSASVVTEVASLANSGTSPFLLWNWSDFGDDRLGDFWAYTDWGSRPQDVTPQRLAALPGGFYGWGYSDTGDPRQLCLLARAFPDLRVVTTQATLAAQLRNTCPASGMHFFVIPKHD
jgi:hypothetical protein